MRGAIGARAVPWQKRRLKGYFFSEVQTGPGPALCRGVPGQPGGPCPLGTLRCRAPLLPGSHCSRALPSAFLEKSDLER